MEVVGVLQRAWDDPRDAHPNTWSHLSPQGSKGRLVWSWARAHHHHPCVGLAVLQGDRRRDTASPATSCSLSSSRGSGAACEPQPLQRSPGAATPDCALGGLKTPVQLQGLEAPS